ncbi:copper amine oxidase N-terminal domain-containing protein [Bacillus tianshenii]|nr:copper amine oxidase N-terminal domain-containing protein [Bacillus tianshenii]
MKYKRSIFFISIMTMLLSLITSQSILADDDYDEYEEHEGYDEHEEDDDDDYDDYKGEEYEKEPRFENTIEMKETWHTWSRSASNHLSYEQLPFMKENQAYITVDESRIQAKVIPYQGQIYVPLASISALLGAEYHYYEDIKACEVILNNHHLIMKEGSTVVYEDMKKTPLPQPVLTSNNELFAPFSVITNGLGYTVTWDEKDGFLIKEGADTSGEK